MSSTNPAGMGLWIIHGRRHLALTVFALAIHGFFGRHPEPARQRILYKVLTLIVAAGCSS